MGTVPVHTGRLDIPENIFASMANLFGNLLKKNQSFARGKYRRSPKQSQVEVPSLNND
jgi:hypothetical protein